MPAAKSKVLIVDDSALIRSMLKEIISSFTDFEVVGAAPDPYVARDMIKQLNPDVLTLDVEMPRMDGLDFLERLMRLRPMPVVMISSLTERGAEVTLRALELGAIDFVTKPKAASTLELEQYADEIVEKLRAAVRAKIRVTTTAPKTAEPKPPLKPRFSTSEKVICIGASTGGTEAIKEVLLRMPSDSPGIVIAQHMPPGFTRSFADRLDRLCDLHVVEAKGGERILPGHVFIAPGDDHLLLKRSGANYITELSKASPVNRHRPSVDVLFNSAAESAAQNAIGVILTGMGRDGAQGLLAMRNAGSFTIAQDEQSCVVYGMPKEAVTIGAVESIVALDQIAEQILNATAVKSKLVRI
ncbi:MAG: chemotaxis response regulator protein-glutamate methylesterase [Spongiibacteraceae bacterium]